MKNIIASLDILAAHLEHQCGLPRMAETLDTVTNTLLGGKPEVETEQYREKYSALQDWVRVLHNSVLSSTVSAKLNRLLQTPPVLDRVALESTPEWHAFLMWLHTQMTTLGPVIPVEYCSPRVHELFRWEDLAVLPDLLDIKFSAARPGEEKSLDSEAQARREHVERHGPSMSPARQRAESLFSSPHTASLSRLATILMSPKFQKLDRLLRGLLPQDTRGGVPTTVRR
jgi:hypothetical protein